MTQSPTYVCVITYRYERVFSIPNHPTSKALAEWQAAECQRLFAGNEHVVSAEVYPESDYLSHLVGVP